VVLIGDGRSEKRHDPVAHPPVDGALVKLNGRRHPVANRLEQTSDIIRIAVGHEHGRAGDVREEHGDLLALVVESARNAGSAARGTIGSS
jgi:hypothetical protein